MQKPTPFTAKLEEKIEFSAEFTQYTFELVEPHRMQFEAGQYVSLKVSDMGLSSLSIISRGELAPSFCSLCHLVILWKVWGHWDNLH